MAEKKRNEVLLIAIRFADDTIGIMSYLMKERNGTVLKGDTDAEIEAEIARTPFDQVPGKLPIKGWWNLRTDSKTLNRQLEGTKPYRKAWRFDKDTRSITFDMDAARSKHLFMIRYHRDKRLRELDGQYMAATAKGDAAAAAAVEAERQRLRDIPQTFDLTGATTIQELRALWPSGITNRFKQGAMEP
jgi:hypothetical protein